EAGIRCDYRLKRRPRYSNDLTSLNNTGGHEDPLPGQEIQLTQEVPWTVANNEALLAIGTDHNLDGSRTERVEVVGGVSLLIEVLAYGHRPRASERLENV